jgi:nitrate reductase NapE
MSPGSALNPAIGRTLLAQLPGEHMSDRSANTDRDAGYKRRMEIYAFLIVTAVLMPALAVATVGGYGLAVWIYQMIAGPPGPPS